MKIISYNLHFHRAAVDLSELVQTYSPDILCLQETKVQLLPESIHDMRLVATTDVGDQGLAVYVSGDYSLQSHSAHVAPLSLHERVFPEQRQRILLTNIVNNRTDTAVTVVNFHATHLVTTNAHRRRQLLHTLDVMEKSSINSTPTIIIGDFNYPICNGRLSRLARRHDYDFATTVEPTYYGRGIRLWLDFAMTRQCSDTHLVALPRMSSDHVPILLTTA